MNRLLFATRNFKDKFNKVIHDRQLLKAYIKTYLLGYFDSVEPDVYIISYPKSGYTWLRVLFLEYLKLSGEYPEHFNNYFFMRLHNRKTVKFDHEQAAWVPAPKRKISFNYSKYSGCRVIILVRDPRDILVSSWYHLTFREKIYRDDISSFIRDELVGIKRVISFMNMWVENSSVLKDFQLISYERMHRDTIAGFRSVLEFIGIRVDEVILRQAVENCSFGKMKNIEVKEAFEEPWMRPGFKGQVNSMKVRQGKVGGYRQEFSENDIEFLNQVIRENLSSKLPYHK